VPQVWLTMSGAILCIEQHFEDWFGRDGLTLVGEPFAGLSTDMESLHRFVAAAAEQSHPELEASQPTITCRLLHKYIEPMEVEVAAVPGGGSAQGMRWLLGGLAVMSEGNLQCRAPGATMRASKTGAPFGRLAWRAGRRALPPPPHTPPAHTSTQAPSSSRCWSWWCAAPAKPCRCW
jgi:hypothetical protein